ncbi:hypothetical protein TrVE_jg2110 [Triparma verrucosa]|uniref:Uncharacterized protein n=1 Tax=Triparma verrucosa TaxID=1606542 RepID=A0A9W7C070_9STRA|nr:hypothetical protein TrVE_jg2110 [Triparma verrucosa]
MTSHSLRSHYDWDDEAAKTKRYFGPIKRSNVAVATYKSTKKNLHNIKTTFSDVAQDLRFAEEKIVSGGEEERITVKVDVQEIKFLSNGEDLKNQRWNKVKTKAKSFGSAVKKTVASPMSSSSVKRGLKKMNVTNTNTRNLLNSTLSALSPRDTAFLSNPKKNKKRVQASDPFKKDAALELPDYNHTPISKSPPSTSRRSPARTHLHAHTPPPKHKLPSSVFLTLSSKHTKTVSTQPFNILSPTVRWEGAQDATPQSPIFSTDIPQLPSCVILRDPQSDATIQTIQRNLSMHLPLTSLTSPTNTNLVPLYKTLITLSLKSFPSAAILSTYTFNLTNLRLQLVDSCSLPIPLTIFDSTRKHRISMTVDLSIFPTPDDPSEQVHTGLPKILNYGISKPSRTPNGIIPTPSMTLSSASSSSSYDSDLDEHFVTLATLKRAMLLKRRNKALKFKKEKWQRSKMDLEDLHYNVVRQRQARFGRKCFESYYLLCFLGCYLIVGYLVNELIIAEVLTETEEVSGLVVEGVGKGEDTVLLQQITEVDDEQCVPYVTEWWIEIEPIFEQEVEPTRPATTPKTPRPKKKWSWAAGSAFYE